MSAVETGVERVKSYIEHMVSKDKSLIYQPIKSYSRQLYF